MKKFFVASVLFGLVAHLLIIFGPYLLNGNLELPISISKTAIFWALNFVVFVVAVRFVTKYKPTTSEWVALGIVNVLGFYLAVLILWWVITQTVSNWRLF